MITQVKISSINSKVRFTLYSIMNSTIGKNCSIVYIKLTITLYLTFDSVDESIKFDHCVKNTKFKHWLPVVLFLVFLFFQMKAIEQ